MNTGKRIRMKQILREDGRTVIVALDHGGIAGNMPGIENPALTIRACRQGGAVSSPLVASSARVRTSGIAR
jgi:DhnA family fructose-bisphosphate aldolase class Ia